MNPVTKASSEPDEGARLFGIYQRAIERLEEIVILCRDIKERHVTPELFLAVVEAPYPTHLALEARPPAPPNLRRKPLAGTFMVLTFPAHRLWFYGSRDLLGTFLDISREIARLVRVIRPDIDARFIVGPDVLPEDVEALEAHFWPLFGLMSVDQPGDSLCERVRWASPDLGRVPYHAGQYARWRAVQDHPGPEISREANITWFDRDVFTLSGHILETLIGREVTRAMLALADHPDTPDRAVRAIEKRLGRGDQQSQRKEARDKFIYEEVMREITYETIASTVAANLVVRHR